ncbi:addiction module protein [Sorangium sp. So ce296]|uniref:addiction module protein n=2 Tax=Sorangium TaxID=39643 RepID=UPI003F604200
MASSEPPPSSRTAVISLFPDKGIGRFLRMALPTSAVPRSTLGSDVPPLCAAAASATLLAMSLPAEELLDQAMKLPESERRVLALRLLESVGDESPEEVERAWVEEARRRLDDVRAGRSQPVPWEEARRRIFARLR